MRLAIGSRPGKRYRAIAYPPRLAITVVVAVTTNAVTRLLRSQRGKRVLTHSPV